MPRRRRWWSSLSWRSWCWCAPRACSDARNKVNKTTLGFTVLIVGGAVLPLFGVYPTFLMQCWCFALFACAFNLLLGYTGLLSFGHAAFFAAAGYLAGHSIKVWGWPPEAGIVAGAAFAAVLGWVFGSLAIRR